MQVLLPAVSLSNLKAASSMRVGQSEFLSWCMCMGYFPILTICCSTYDGKVVSMLRSEALGCRNVVWYILLSLWAADVAFFLFHFCKMEDLSRKLPRMTAITITFHFSQFCAENGV